MIAWIILAVSLTAALFWSGSIIRRKGYQGASQFVEIGAGLMLFGMLSIPLLSAIVGKPGNSGNTDVGLSGGRLLPFAMVAMLTAIVGLLSVIIGFVTFATGRPTNSEEQANKGQS